MHRKIKNDRISLQKEEKIQGKFWLELNEILQGNLNYQSKDQIIKTKNVKKVFNGHGKFLIFIKIILEWYLRLNTN